MIETWKPVLGYEGLYEVSDLGRVRSLPRTATRRNGTSYRVRGGMLHPTSSREDGRPSVVLANSGHYLPARVHRLVFEAFNGPTPPGYEVDHANGDAADNRLVNLRLATKSQNTMNRGLLRVNTSGAKGVAFDRRARKWRAYITVRRRRIHLGMHETVESAAAAYAEAARRLHGEFVRPGSLVRPAPEGWFDALVEADAPAPAAEAGDLFDLLSP